MSRPWLERLWYPKADTGLTHALATPALAAASVAFRSAANLHRWLSPAPRRVDGVHVVSVGNLHVGGAGKTPVVLFLAQRALAQRRRVAVLSRGFGRRSTLPQAFDSRSLPTVDDVGDEPRLLAERCPGLRVFVDADRVRAARAAQREGFDWLILDDGFQHRRLARDVDLVVLDDEVLFGSGRRLPWGPLREPPQALARASLVWRRAALDGLPRPRLHPNEVRAAHRVRSSESIRDKAVLVVTGVARPSSVVQSAEQLGARVVGTRFFADHHLFTHRQLIEVQRAAQSINALLLTTEKDAQRLPAGFAVTLGFELEVLEGLPLLLKSLGLESDGAA